MGWNYLSIPNFNGCTCLQQPPDIFTILVNNTDKDFFKKMYVLPLASPLSHYIYFGKQKIYLHSLSLVNTEVAQANGIYAHETMLYRVARWGAGLVRECSEWRLRCYAHLSDIYIKRVEPNALWSVHKHIHKLEYINNLGTIYVWTMGSKQKVCAKLSPLYH